MSFKKYGGRQFRSANNIILSQHGTFYNQLVPTKIGDENIVSKIYTDLYVDRNLTVNGTFYMQTFLTDDLHVTGFAAIDKDLTMGDTASVFFQNGGALSSYTYDGSGVVAMRITDMIETNGLTIYNNSTGNGRLLFASETGGIDFASEGITYRKIEFTGLDTVLYGNVEIADNLQFSDETIQSTAFSTEKDTLLSDIWDNTQYITSYPYTYVREDTTVTITNTVLSGNIDTNSISVYAGENTSGSIVFASTNTGGSIVFPDETVQTTAWNPTSSSSYITASVSGFLTEREGDIFTSKYILDLQPGMYCIEGVFNVTDLNEVKKLLFNLKLVNGFNASIIYESPQIGIDRQSYDTNYTNFRNPIYWNIYLPRTDTIDDIEDDICLLYVSVNHWYKVNPEFTSEFSTRIVKIS